MGILDKVYHTSVQNIEQLRDGITEPTYNLSLQAQQERGVFEVVRRNWIRRDQACIASKRF